MKPFIASLTDLHPPEPWEGVGEREYSGWRSGVERTEQREAGGLGATVLLQLKGSGTSTWQLEITEWESYLLRSTQGVTLGTRDAHLQDSFLFLGDNHQ